MISICEIFRIVSVNNRMDGLNRPCEGKKTCSKKIYSLNSQYLPTDIPHAASINPAAPAQNSVPHGIPVVA